jgi:hypothetical protein
VAKSGIWRVTRRTEIDTCPRWACGPRRRAGVSAGS